MANISNALAIQEVMNVRVFDIQDHKKLLLRMEKELTETTVSGSSDTVYATGKNGVKLVGFGTNKAFMVSGTSAYVNLSLLGLQLGSDFETVNNGKEVRKEEILTVSGANTVLTTFTATGTAGEEIKYIEVLDAYGNTVKTLTQAVAASATEFTYDSGTRTVTFDTSITEGTRVIVAYFPEYSQYRKMANEINKYQKLAYIEMDAMFKDACASGDGDNAELVSGKIIIPRGQISGNMELAQTGDPSTHAFEIEALGGCGTNTLNEIILYDESDAVI